MQQTSYQTNLKLGEVRICFISPWLLAVSGGTEGFCERTDQADVVVQIASQTKNMILPRQSCGGDMILDYYQDGTDFYAAARGGTKDSAMITVYSEDFSKVSVFLNEEDFPGMIRTVDKLLQLFPIRQLLLNYHAMILHSSRVEVDGKAILFTAPSQTGKTTQARLWHQYEGAEIVSNDKTLIQRVDQKFSTYGYPVDGSSPVYSRERLPLGAIVVLRQGPASHVERLSVFKALKYLMEQTVADHWNKKAMEEVHLLWMELLNHHPVYLLTCTPDQEAVECLKMQLEKDEVI